MDTTEQIDWVRLPKAGHKLEGIGRSTLYKLMDDGILPNRSLKTHKFNQRGIRLIHLPSLKKLIEDQPEPEAKHERSKIA